MGILAKFGFGATPAAPSMVLSQELFESSGAYADQDCVQAVVNYVNAAQTGAFLRFAELPPLAQQVYEVDRYLAQVNNGGHAQYAFNCGQQFDLWLPLVEKGLVAMGAKSHLKIFREFSRRWGAAGFDPATRDREAYHNAFSTLDDLFFKLNKAQPISGYSAKLIRRSKPQVLPNDALASAFAEMAEANPFLQSRREAAEVARIGTWFTDPTLVAAGILLGTSEDPDMLEAILPGQVVMYQNQQTPALRLKTATGQAHAVFMHDLYTLHDVATEEEITAERTRREEGRAPDPDVDWHHYAFALQGIGQRRAMLMPEMLDMICKMNTAKSAGLAAHDLLKTAGLSAPSAVGWLGKPATLLVGLVSWVLRTDEGYFTLIMEPKGYSLYARENDNALARIDYETLNKRKADLLD